MQKDPRNAQRNREYRDRQRGRGYVQISYWLPDTSAARRMMSVLADRLRSEYDAEQQAEGPSDG